MAGVVCQTEVDTLRAIKVVISIIRNYINPVIKIARCMLSSNVYTGAEREIKDRYR